MPSKNLEGLQPGATYNIQLVPKSGVGPSSLVVQVKVPTVPPTGVPISASNTVVPVAYSGQGAIVLGPNGPGTPVGTLWLDGNGIQAYNSSSQRTIFINSNDGTASFAGTIYASAGYIGGPNGWAITSGLLSSGAGSNYVGIQSTGTYAFYAGNPTASVAPFSVTNTGILVANSASISGTITASSGNIAGWSLAQQEIYTGTGNTKIAMNSGPSNPKFYIGQGNHGDINTGFYADSTGKFSLSNQVVFNPGLGIYGASVIVGTASAVSNSSGSNAVPYSVIYGLNNSSGFIKANMGVTNAALAQNTYVIAVSGASNPATASISPPALSGVSSSSFVFQFTEFGDFNVAGTITGKVNSIKAIDSARIATTITSASLNTSASTITFVTSGHSFAQWDRIIFEGANSTAIPSASQLNYSSSVGNAYAITTASNSVNFQISYQGYPVTMSGSYGTITGSVSVQEMTMGLHPQEGLPTGTSSAYYHPNAIGLRLDKYNWWFVNNGGFRVGSQGSYFKWDGSQFRIQGGGSKSILMQVGSADATNLISITSGTPTWNNANTPFYVDGTGSFSLGTALTWDNATLKVAGTITASSGSIGGFALANNQLYTASVIVSSSGGISLGNPAVFTADQYGNIIANSASIKGLINGLTVGFGSANSDNSNIALGATALASNTQYGTYNVAIGNALNLAASANFAVSIGHQSMEIMNGAYNIAIGKNAMQGRAGTAIGNTSASWNIAIGYNALLFGGNSRNIALGYNSLYNAYLANDSIAIGTAALSGSSGPGGAPGMNGDLNIAIGSSALFSVSTGTSNVAIGPGTLINVTTGTSNVAIGLQSLQKLKTSSYNLAIGIYSTTNLTTGSFNVGVGYQSNSGLIIGSGNTSIGFGASNSDGSYNTAIGYGVGSLVSGLNGTVSIGVDSAGNQASPAVSNDFILGTQNHNVKVAGTLTSASLLMARSGGGALYLVAGANDHVYMSFYPRTSASTTRGGYFGFPGGGVTYMTWANEIGDINITPKSGSAVNLNGHTWSYNSNYTNYYTSLSQNLFSIRNASLGNGSTYAYVLAPSIYNQTPSTATSRPVRILGTGVAGYPDYMLYSDTSSRRYKKQIVDYDRSTEEILKLRPVFYVGINDPTEYEYRQAGFIAEDIDESGLKEFVYYTESNVPEAVHYERITAALMKVAKDQHEQIKQMQSQIENLSASIVAINAIINQGG